MKFSEWLEQRDRFSRPTHGGRPGAAQADTSGGYTDQYGLPIRGAEDIIKSQTPEGGSHYDVAGSTVSKERKGMVNRALFGPRKVSWRPKTGSGKGGAIQKGDETPNGALMHYPQTGGPKTMVNPGQDAAGNTGTPIYYRGHAPFTPAKRLGRENQ